MSKCCWSRATETLNINSFRYYIQECHQGAAPLAACSVACLSCLHFIGATRVSPTSKNVFLVSWPNKGEAKTSNLWVIFETNGLKTNFLLLTILVCLFDLGFRLFGGNMLLFALLRWFPSTNKALSAGCSYSARPLLRTAYFTCDFLINMNRYAYYLLTISHLCIYSANIFSAISTTS